MAARSRLAYTFSTVRKISLETRVLGLFGMLVAALLLGSLLLVHVHIERRAQTSVREELTVAQRVFEELLATRAQGLIHAAVLVAELPVLREAAKTWDPEVLAAAFREINRLIGSEVLILTDRMGVILARSDRRWETGEIFDQTTSVARALRGGRAASMWVQNGRLYQMVSVPLRLPTGLAGTLSVGYGVDAEFARELSKLSGNDIAFLVGEDAVVSSRPLAEEEVKEIRRLASGLLATEPAFGTVDLSRSLPAVVVAPFIGWGAPVGAYAILHSLAAETAGLAALERRLAASAVVGLLAVLAIGYGISRSVTRPLTALSTAAQELSAGNYDFELPPPSGSSEVEDLTRAFERMGRSLRERVQELQDLTAHLEEMVRSRTAELEQALGENHRLVAELEQWSDELERKVAERTRELTEAQRQLVRQDRVAAIGRLAAGIAHEINNPLGALSGFSEGLLDRARDPTLASQPAFVDFPEHLRLINQEVDRLKTIVQKFLRFARSPVPKAELMDLNDVAREVVSLLANHARREGKVLALDLHGESLWVEADPEQLKQVLLNLALNGLDAVERAGEVKIRSRGRWETAELRVEDNGAGFSPEARRHLFEPFFSTKPPEKGTGLGLALCYDLVKENGGELELAEGGIGTVFVIRLPAARAKESRAHA